VGRGGRRGQPGAVWMEPVVQGRAGRGSSISDLGWVVACGDGGAQS
jgi:hypothetical protein